MPGDSHRTLRAGAAFAAGSTITGVGVAAMLRLSARMPPAFQSVGLCASLVVGGAFAAVLASSAGGLRRVAAVAFTAVGFALGGFWFALLMISEAGLARAWFASSVGWSAAGLLIACGFAGWDRRLWLLLIGPAAFGAGGAVSWPVLALIRPTDAFIVLGVIGAPALGGTLFGALTARLDARAR